MKTTFKKVKMVHHIIDGFDKILLEIEKHPSIHRIIPGRISRQQKGSSQKIFKISYQTESGVKCIMSQGATAQEVFIICDAKQKEILMSFLQQLHTRTPIT